MIHVHKVWKEKMATFLISILINLKYNRKIRLLLLHQFMCEQNIDRCSILLCAKFDIKYRLCCFFFPENNHQVSNGKSTTNATASPFMRMDGIIKFFGKYFTVM